jgi:hypothetical protein
MENMVGPNVLSATVPKSFIVVWVRALWPAVPIHGQVKVVGCDIRILAISPHNLAGRLSRTTKPVLPVREPFLLD